MDGQNFDNGNQQQNSNYFDNGNQPQNNGYNGNQPQNNGYFNNGYQPQNGGDNWSQTQQGNPYYNVNQPQQNGNYQDNTANIPYQTVPVPADNGSGKANGLQVASLILGIFSIVLCCCYGVPSIILGIVGIICAIMGNKESKSGVGTGGLVCSIIGIVLGFTMLALVVVGLMAGGMEEFLNAYDYYY